MTMPTGFVIDGTVHASGGTTAEHVVLYAFVRSQRSPVARVLRDLAAVLDEIERVKERLRVEAGLIGDET